MERLFSINLKVEGGKMKKIIQLFILVSILIYANTVFAITNVTLEWNPNTESDLASYKIYQSNTSGVYNTGTNVGDVTTYTLTLPDGNWYFALTALDTNGNESGYSNEVTTVLDSTAPANPAGLNITITIIVNP